MEQLRHLLSDFVSGRTLPVTRHPLVHDLSCGQKLTPAELRCGTLLLMLNGELQLRTLYGKDASETLLSRGQAYCVNDSARRVLFVARDDVRLLVLPEEHLFAVLRQDPSLKNRLLECLTGQMHDAEQIVHLSQFLLPEQGAPGAAMISLALRFGLDRLRSRQSL